MYDEQKLRLELEKRLLYTPEYNRRQRAINNIIKSVADLETERIAAEADFIDQTKLAAKTTQDLNPIGYGYPQKAHTVANIANCVKELEDAAAE